MLLESSRAFSAMEQQAEAPLDFSSRPPACLGLLGDEKVDSDTVERVFQDEARNLQGRLREQLSQLRIELGLFLRLMYKNKNQHRRTLYYQRLSEVLLRHVVALQLPYSYHRRVSLISSTKRNDFNKHEALGTWDSFEIRVYLKRRLLCQF